MQHAPFELHVLGPTEFHGSRAELDDANLRPPKRLALLTWLALETADGYRRRDQIVGLFWPDLEQDAARTQLRKALFGIRESLGPDAFLTRGEGEVRLDSERTWCDAVALVQHIKQGRWTEALALYRGELLEGLFPERVSQEFEEWLADRRKSLREQAARSAWECSRIEEERGDRKAASVMARRALDLSPDDEEGVRRLIVLLDRHGDRGGALRVYSEWQARLQAEYGVEPAPETRKLARKVQAARKGESHETPPTQQFLAPVPLPESGGTPPRPTPMRQRWLLVALGALLLGAAVAVGALASGGTITRDLSSPSVAVLPLRTIGDVALTSAAEGLTEELTTALAMTPGLSVRPANRSREAAGRGEDLHRIGKRLGVSYLVDGGVQSGGGRLRVTLRLVRTADGVAIWAGSYDPEGTDAISAARLLAADAVGAIRSRVLRIEPRADHPR